MAPAKTRNETKSDCVGHVLATSKTKLCWTLAALRLVKKQVVQVAATSAQLRAICGQRRGDSPAAGHSTHRGCGRNRQRCACRLPLYSTQRCAHGDAWATSRWRQVPSNWSPAIKGGLLERALLSRVSETYIQSPKSKEKTDLWKNWPIVGFHEPSACIA